MRLDDYNRKIQRNKKVRTLLRNMQGPIADCEIDEFVIDMRKILKDS